MNLYSYVVRYDSGFAPNPFYNFCSLATCKPRIRRNARLGDWIVGVGSANKVVQQGGKLVYAMKVSEILSFNDYFEDERFQNKKPNQIGSRKQARGDNIYIKVNDEWLQSDSFHSEEDGSKKTEHIDRDTQVDRVLIGENYTYFGANGPLIPEELISNGKSLCHKGISESKFTDADPEDRSMMEKFILWLESLEESGFCGDPYDWHDSQ